jgi:hypothetical protein
LENGVLKLEAGFSSQSVSILEKHFSEVGNRPDWVSITGNTLHPFIRAILWKPLFQKRKAKNLTD